jgi:hypothetical protein
MTTRESQGHLLELYGLDVLPDLISAVADAVLEAVAEWQNRPLEAMHPLVFFDALRVKIRDEGLVCNKAVYIALGVTPEGTKDILGLWIETSEGAKFWLRVMNELKNRGVGDILIAVVDGLKGFPDAINAVFPQTIVQTCVVHLIRNSMDFASWKDRKPIAAELKKIYRVKDADAGKKALDELTLRPGARNCLSRRGPPHQLHGERHRSTEREIAPRGSNPRSFSERRSGDEIALSRLAPSRRKMENAAARMVRGKDPICHHVRRKVRYRVMALASHAKFPTVL